MGIEIYPKAEIPARGLFRRRPGRDQLFAEIQQAIVAFVDDPLLAHFLRFEPVEHTLNVLLHPAAPPLEFTWDVAGVVACVVKTSTAGPGFHAFVVDLLDAVAEQCRLKWQWSGADETDYAITRDFGAVQSAMRSFLCTLARGVLDMDSDEMSNIAINWPLNASMPDNVGFTVTCMGPLDRGWWETVGNEASDHHAESFFSWWNKERDAAFWKNLGMALLWTEVPWHPPADEAENEICQLALDCFGRAKDLDSDIGIPEEEVAELQKMLEARPDDDPVPPRSRRIGFRRGQMSFPATGAWTVTIPGYFYQRWDEESTQYTYWFGSRTIHASSFSVTGKDGRPVPAAELLEFGKDEENPEAQKVVFSNLHLAGQASICQVEEDGRRYWQLQGKMATTNTLCIVTICFEDPADREWAITTFKSVKHPSADDQTGNEG